MSRRGLASRLASLSVRDRRALAWGGLLVAPAVLLAQVVRPTVSAFVELGARLERERDLLQREENLLADAPRYPVQYQRAEQQLLDKAPSLFAGPDLVAASSALGSYVNGQAYTHRVMIQRSEPGPPVASGAGVARLRLDVQGVSDLEGIVGLLDALESGKKLVSVERLAIAARPPVAPASPSVEQETLAFGATVVGYALGDSVPSPAAEKR